MPGLRFYSPELPVELKRIMAKELTDAVVRSLNLLEEGRNWTIVQFMPFKLENCAIGGSLMNVDAENPFYYLEILDSGLTREKKETLVRELTPLMANLLNLAPHQLYKLSILFQEYKPEDMARAGRFLSQMGMPVS